MEEIEVVVPNRPGKFGYPYIAHITDYHPTFIFKRTFFPYNEVRKLADGKVFTIMLPEKGIFEFCIRYWDCKTKKLCSREREWFLLYRGDAFSIDYREIDAGLDCFSTLLSNCINRDMPNFMS